MNFWQRLNLRGRGLLTPTTKPLPTAEEEREAIKEIILAEKSMHEFTKSEIGVAVCNSILACIEAERE